MWILAILCDNSPPNENLNLLVQRKLLNLFLYTVEPVQSDT
jgi:hypothetical protein